MAYKYRSITQGPPKWFEAGGVAEVERPKPEIHESANARSAVDYARAQRERPGGTTIRIERIMMRGRTGGGTPAKAWLTYRAYIVGDDGIVRRTQ